MPDHRADEFDDARADVGAVHDETGEDEERQREKDEAARPALGIHHDGHHVRRTRRLDADDADGCEREANGDPRRDEPEEHRRQDRVQRVRMCAEIRFQEHQQQHRAPHRNARRHDRGTRPAEQRKPCSHDEERAAEGDRQGHPHIADAK